MKQIPYSEALLIKDSQLIKAKLSGKPVTQVIEGELMVYLKTTTIMHKSRESLDAQQEAETMDVQKEAEQLKDQLFSIGQLLAEGTDGETWDKSHKKAEALILQSFERICREQREACYKQYKTTQATNILKKVMEVNSVNYKGEYEKLSVSILDTPLLTDNK